VVRSASGPSGDIRAAGGPGCTPPGPKLGHAPVRAPQRGGQAAPTTAPGKPGHPGASVRRVRRGRGEHEQRCPGCRRGQREQRRRPAHARAGCGQPSGAGLLVPGGPRRGVHRRTRNRHRRPLLKVAAAAGAYGRMTGQERNATHVTGPRAFPYVTTHPPRRFVGCDKARVTST
ncbi:hypothetical protein V5799_019496, partial [Amblyomma americanum]